MSLGPPLAQLLFATSQVVAQVKKGQSLSAVLTALDPKLKPGVQALSFFSLRYLNRAQVLRQQLLIKKAPNHLVEALLDVSLSLLSVTDFSALETPSKMLELERNFWPNYDSHTLVNETVKACTHHKKTRAFKGLVNACLRRYLREKKQLLANAWEQEEVRYTFPQWWIDLLKQAYPAQWQELLKVSNLPGSLTLRANRRKIVANDLLTKFKKEQIEAHVLEDQAIILDQAQAVQILPGYQEGWFSVQDLAAQKMIHCVPLNTGDRVLDACAAPGGKGSQLLEYYDLDLTLLDIDAQRLERLKENFERLNLVQHALSLQIKAADATNLAAWYSEPFDVVIADVPCTASGIVRRHPDIKYLRRASDLAQMIDLQRQIVDALWQTVKPGGYFLYMTCSIFPQENEQQAQYILEHCQQAIRLDAPGQLLPLPDQTGYITHDGFFYALFQKTTTNTI